MFLGFQGNSRGNHVFYRQISGGSCRFPFVQFWKYESNLPQNAIAYPEMPSRALQKIDLRYLRQSGRETMVCTTFFFMGESRMIQRAPVEILPRWHCGDDDDDEEGQGMKMTMAAGRLLF